MTLLLEQKLNRLAEIVVGYGTVAIGYSGGVDSVFLAKFATDVLGPARVVALTGVSAAVPSDQLESARECAQRFGIRLVEVSTYELDDPNYASNPSNRCYFCKTELWKVLSEVARQHGMAILADGTNADDVSDYRPGAAAGKEWGIHSPLLEAGFTKADIRAASRDLGLPTWDQPAAPCLSSRLPYGTAVTPARLHEIDVAERALRLLGLHEFRVRHHGDAARLEVGRTELDQLGEQIGAVLAAVKGAGFARVLIDVEGYRRGALNEGLSLVQLSSAR